MDVGIDVAKAELAVAVRPGSERWAVANDERGVRTLAGRLRRDGPALVVLEATGGYALLAVAALGAAGLPVVVANPRQAYACACGTSRGRRGSWRRPTGPTPTCWRASPSACVRQRAPCRTTRSRNSTRSSPGGGSILEMLTAERNRLGQALGRGRRPVKKSPQAHIAFLEREVRVADSELGAMARASPVWRERDELFRSVPGVGPVRSRTLLAGLPELGRLTRREVAKLAGVAPLARDSGTLRRRRVVHGGRAPVRAVLYMAALVATKRNPVIRVLPAAPRRREAEEARARRLHAGAAHHPRRDGPDARPLACREHTRDPLTCETVANAEVQLRADCNHRGVAASPDRPSAATTRKVPRAQSTTPITRLRRASDLI